MRQGHKVIDVDTHVTPSSQVLLRYADQEFERIAGREFGGSDDDNGAASGAGARGALEGRTKNEATKTGHERIQHDNDNAERRLLDMDVEGVDVNLIIPGTWAPGSSALDLSLPEGLSFLPPVRDRPLLDRVA